MKTPKRLLFFQESENAKNAHIQAPEIAKMVDRFFMPAGGLQNSAKITAEPHICFIQLIEDDQLFQAKKNTLFDPLLHAS